VFFHTDCAQAVGKIPLDVEAMNIDLMSISGHKIYGPKGIGALYVRRKPRVRMQALIHGGGQERGMRSGTLPTPLCVGLGEAAAICQREMAQETARLEALRDRFMSRIDARLPEVFMNGDARNRIPGNLNLSFAYVEGEGLMMGIKDLSVSSGSACTSASLEPSYVLPLWAWRRNSRIPACASASVASRPRRRSTTRRTASSRRCRSCGR